MKKRIRPRYSSAAQWCQHRGARPAPTRSQAPVLAYAALATPALGSAIVRASSGFASPVSASAHTSPYHCRSPGKAASSEQPSQTAHAEPWRPHPPRRRAAHSGCGLASFPHLPSVPGGVGSSWLVFPRPESSAQHRAQSRTRRRPVKERGAELHPRTDWSAVQDPAHRSADSGSEGEANKLHPPPPRS